MKTSCILLGLAFGLPALARQLHRPAHVARQDDCTWPGHCLGDECEVETECDGWLTCHNGVCASTTTSAHATTTKKTTTRKTSTTAKPTPTATCEWAGHCLGAPCDTYDDCDGQLICTAGKCAPIASSIVTSTRRPTVTPTRTSTSTKRTTTSTTTPKITSTSTTRAPTTTTTAAPTTPVTPSCGLTPLACIGVKCTTDADCGFDLIICKDGICGL
ncbi:hypothetical protein B0T22DRAFT_509725 [Podospora appendiculata]|uniref:Uncharacterized protein n=1 Tax=Podospora appendiculata TaxID=314037 RepID=A0AAE0X7F8_9PEZI|nr:hypothetical protein B0T22DRAFT_509725 [Podospora appendiculata]